MSNVSHNQFTEAVKLISFLEEDAIRLIKHPDKTSAETYSKDIGLAIAYLNKCVTIINQAVGKEDDAKLF